MHYQQVLSLLFPAAVATQPPTAPMIRASALTPVPTRFSLFPRQTGALFVLLITLLVRITPVFAVHDTGVFELDGNSVPAVTDDFDTIFTGPGGSFDNAFISDSTEPDASHHEPSNKDFQPLSAWGCIIKPNVNDKLDIRHSYVATYAVGGDAISFFGADRDSSNGDANIGYWFFQDRVQCDPAIGTFTGKKRDGDLLLVSAFTGGGAFPGVDIYRWNDPTPLAPESGDETLDLLSAGANCQLTPDPPGHHAVNANICGTTNETPISVAWEVMTGRNPIAEETYFEGGINLSAVNPGICYASVMAETRSSQSFDATLFDITLAEVSTCGSISVEKVTDPSGNSQLFDFTTAGGPNATNDAFQLKDGDPTHATLSLLPGLYTVTEAAVPGWDLTGATCRGGVFGAGAPYTNGSPILLTTGDKVVCTFVNTLQPAVADTSITVDKVTFPADHPQGFDFITAGGPVLINDAFQLKDADSSHTTLGLQLGVYTVTETVPTGWTLTGVTCRGGVFGAGAPYINGSPIVLATGDKVVCTFVNTLTIAGITAGISVDKTIISPSGNPAQLFDFTIAGGPGIPINDAFQLADATPAHTLSNLQAGMYTVTETPMAGWWTAATCIGGAFGAGGSYTNGDPITVGPGDQTSCTFTNLELRPAAPNFCQKTTVTAILQPAGGRFPGNTGLDHLIRVDLGESIQDVINIASDFNGDGYIIIGVINNGSGKYGGHVSQSIVIDQIYAEPFALIGCSVTLHDPTPFDSQPTAHITSTAASPDLFIMDLHTADSTVAGWLVEGNNRTLRNVNAVNNDVGIWLIGDNNTMHNGAAQENVQSNMDIGILIEGNSNTITGARSFTNGSHGIQVIGNNNQLIKNAVGDRSKGNGDNGININGAGNRLEENSVFANGGDGIEVSGGNAVSPNILKKNKVGDSSKGNGGNGLFIHDDIGNGTPNPLELEANTVRANGLNGILIDAGATGHELKSNKSGGTSSQDNGDCEFAVASGNFNATGNKAGAVAIAGSDGSAFPSGCIGTP